ncbi:DUF2835 family protein [Alteromonas sp. 5E99-2]|uniref:DUF2835 family protein n=1 Tax=Alteromonas sp. 5E99-2 TaxID=2817683 RepID=UPI001A9874A2|nr:DUF2835 family protein [Alteromonas sp. 5E99-2]MBO1255033.1 DUF2835 family protein [Alteromonas sp. 5E99-2]
MAKKVKHFYFNLDVPYHECETIYLQPVPNAVIRAESGERVQVPTARLRQCITREGLKGRYQLTIDEQNKFIKFIKL